MSNEKSKNRLVIIVVFLILIIFGLVGYIIYDKFMSNNDVINVNENNNEEQKIEQSRQYTYEDVAGVYYYETEMYKPIEEEEFYLHNNYFLTLSDDGTFSLDVAVMSHGGLIGNYILKGNKVILNILFSTNNGAGFGFTEDMKQHIELTIKDDNTLLTNNSKIPKFGYKKEINYQFVKKKSTEELEEIHYQNHYNFYSYIEQMREDWQLN
ncbi:MAG: hypothetical protein Q4E75_03275 [bacterium]|nr:hypothetical protein [bacterium]